jgi:hypothetical protein
LNVKVSIHASFIPALLTVASGAWLWQRRARRVLMWSVMSLALWFVATTQATSGGAHFAVAVGAADLCPILQRVREGASIHELPPRERRVVDLLARCHEAAQLVPLDAAVVLLLDTERARLDAARHAPFVDLRLVAELERLVALGDEVHHRLFVLETCKSAYDAMQQLAPLICDGLMFDAL